MKKALLIVLSLVLCTVLHARAAEIADLPQFLNSAQVSKIPAQPAGQPDNFRFVVIGDTRDGDPMFEYLLELAQDTDPLFVINVGDLVHAGHHTEYEHYYDQIKDVRKPYISVIGNHEAHVDGGLQRFVHMFGATDGFFDVGNSRFIYFDNCAANGYNIPDAQFAWLEEALKTDKKKFLFMHAPPGIRVWDHGMRRDATEKFLNLMDKFEVERVYFGHVHAYDRFVRNKTTYVMTGCGGAEPDPLGDRFYHPLGGGYYHFNIVEVRGDKIMDVLVAPSSADIIEFTSPKTGLPLEFGFGAYRHHNTPVLETPQFQNGEIKVRAYNHPLAMEAGITGAVLECHDKKGASLPVVNLSAGLYDERDWSGALPEGASVCSLSVQDPVRARTAMLPAIRDINPALAADPAPAEIPFYSAATDLDDPAQLIMDDMDLRALDFAYDDNYFYIRARVDGVFSEGDKDPRNRVVNIYGFIVINDALEIEADISKMLGSVPLLAYAPLATTLGMPKCGVIDARGYAQGKFSASDKGVKCRADGGSLFIRAERKLFGDKEQLKGFKLIAASLQLLTQPRIDVNMGDATDPVHIILQGVKP